MEIYTTQKKKKKEIFEIVAVLEMYVIMSCMLWGNPCLLSLLDFVLGQIFRNSVLLMIFREDVLFEICLRIC